MPPTNKKQIGFYADADVEDYLDSVPAGTNKTRLINDAIRLYAQQHQNEPLLADRVALLEKRVSKLEKKK